MALKRVVDAGKLNRVVHWVGDASWLRDGVWSAAGDMAGIDLACETFLIRRWLGLQM